MDEDRDFEEEAYWRRFCAECDGACVSTTGHAELIVEVTGHGVGRCGVSADNGKWWSHRECDHHREDACDACRLYREGDFSGAYAIALMEDE